MSVDQWSERAGTAEGRQALAKEAEVGKKILERWANTMGPMCVAGETPFTPNLAANLTSAYNPGYPTDLVPLHCRRWRDER